MDLNFSLFQGASFTLTEAGQDHMAMSKFASMPAVKQVWPIRRYPLPDVQRQNFIENIVGSFSIDEKSINTSDAFSTHAMTQVSKLHALGCK